jgi:hypothetical protein
VALSRSRTVGSIVLLFALAVGSSSVFARGPDALASITTLTVVDGPVVVRHGGAHFSLAREGDVVAAGDTIRTATGASAEITYFQGSSVRLDAGTELVVERLRTQAGGGAVIEIMRTLERTWHVVTKLLDGSSRYEVRTPSSTASVRG